MDCELVAKNIQHHLSEYLTKYDLKAIIIGVSGGIDNAICLALAKPVCRDIKVRVIGRSLPTSSNKKDEYDRALAIGRYFCDDFRTVDLQHIYQANQRFMTMMEGEASGETTPIEKIRLGNIKARLRMIYLYNLAYINKGVVISTDNLTEYNLGFWTLHGDVGDVSPIQYLWKTEVYELSRYMAQLWGSHESMLGREALQACIDAVPTDGLGITSSDLEQFHADSYDEVDATLKSYFSGAHDKNSIKSVIRRHESTHFKRNHPYVFTREMLGLQEIEKGLAPS